jgi:AcrR family transcriptional regulator
MTNEASPGISRALLVGAPRPLLSRRAEAALGARHRSVLDGLEQLLRDGELTTLTIGDIAARLECSRRTLYELAPSKDQLVLLTLDRVMHRIGETAIAAIDFDAPAPVQLRQYATAGIGYVFRSSALDDLSDMPGARRVLDAHHRFAGTLIERIVATGIDRGELRRVDASVAAAVILASAVHLAVPDVLDDLGFSLEDAVDEMLDLVLGGLLDR